jgi:protein-tyrosine-phosphatase
MAEAMLKMSAKRGVQVCSAGIKPGTEINKQAVKAMREVGYDLSTHKCRHISHFSNVTFDYDAKMDVPDLGDMVTANWIVTSTGIYPTPHKAALLNTAESAK